MLRISTLQLMPLLIVLRVAPAYINHRFIRLPNVIGLPLLSRVLSTEVCIEWVARRNASA